MSSAEPASGDAPPKQAACLECRKSKVRCLRETGTSICKRCTANNTECVVPEYHVGRYKGVKNKRSGLEKAIHQVEQALKRSKGTQGVVDGDKDINLRQLLASTEGRSSQSPPNPKRRRSSAFDQYTVHTAPGSVGGSSRQPQTVVSDFVRPRTPSKVVPSHVPAADQTEKPDELALDNADNPLQLLAMASSMPTQSPSTAITPSPAGPGQTPGEHEDAELQQYFGSLMPILDNTHDLDPIEIGLVRALRSLLPLRHDLKALTIVGHKRGSRDAVRLVSSRHSYYACLHMSFTKSRTTALNLTGVASTTICHTQDGA
jgi:hypothetical protein